MPSQFYLRTIQVVLALHAVFATACGGDSPLQPNPVPGRPKPVHAIRVTPSNPEVVVTKGIRLTAMALDADGQDMPEVRVTFGKPDHDFFHLEPGGVLIGATPGTGLLYAEAGLVRELVSVSVLEMPAVALTLDVDTLRLAVGQVVELSATLRDENGVELGGRPLEWSSTDAAVAQVSATGSVTALTAGDARVVVRHAALEAEVVVLVAAPTVPPPAFGGDLVFVRIDPAVGRPHLYRADALRIDETAQPLFGVGGASEPAVSPDGQRIAFTCDGMFGPSICVSPADRSHVRELTGADTYFEDQPTWSPDGQFIAFRRWPHGATPGRFNPPDIWVMRADGTQQVNLTADAGVQGNPAWGPATAGAESRIAYVEESSVDGYLRSQLFTMRVDGTDRRPLTASAEREDLTPAWSPDGRSIAFVRRGGTQFGDIMIVDVASGAERALLSPAMVDEQLHPAWSPNGAYIAFTSAHELSLNGGYRRQVYTVRPDGTGLQRRSTGDFDKLQLAWWPSP